MQSADKDLETVKAELGKKEQQLENLARSKEQLEKREKLLGMIGIPMGRYGEPEDIAAAVVFMASPAASWITGQCLYVTGGR